MAGKSQVSSAASPRPSRILEGRFPIMAFRRRYPHTLYRENIARPSGKLSHVSWPCRTSSTRPACNGRRNQDSSARWRCRVECLSYVKESEPKPSVSIMLKLSLKRLDDHLARFVLERDLTLSSFCRLFNSLIPRIPGPSARNNPPVMRFASSPAALKPKGKEMSPVTARIRAIHNKRTMVR